MLVVYGLLYRWFIENQGVFPLVSEGGITIAPGGQQDDHQGTKNWRVWDE